MMTKKDYILIADSIIEANKTYLSQDYPKTDLTCLIVIEISKALIKDNPRFDDERFFDYVWHGVESFKARINQDV